MEKQTFYVVEEAGAKCFNVERVKINTVTRTVEYEHLAEVSNEEGARMLAEAYENKARQESGLAVA